MDVEVRKGQVDLLPAELAIGGAPWHGQCRVQHVHVHRLRYKVVRRSCRTLSVRHSVSLASVSVSMFIRSILISLAALVAAKEMPKDEVKAAQLFDSGIRHENNKALKLVSQLSALIALH